MDNSNDRFYFRAEGAWRFLAFYYCLLFDVDGTLLDFNAAEDGALRDTLAHFSLPNTEDEMCIRDRAGLRLGWIAGPKALLDQVSRHRDYSTISCGMIDEYLAGIALEHKEAVIARNRACLLYTSRCV